MKLTDPTTMLPILAEASRAPSAHNAQPARWRFEPDGGVLLFEDMERRLRVADPTGHDAAIGLGAAFEGLDLALSRRGAGLGPLDLAADSSPSRVGLRFVGRSSLVPRDAPDVLAPVVPARQTFRGRFLPSDRAAVRRLDALLRGMGRIIGLCGREDIEALATVHDRWSEEFLRRADYRAELRRWLRFSPRDPRWRRDGLTADCLGLPRIAGLFAAALLRPAAFNTLQTLRLTSLLASERSKTRNAAAIAVLTADKDEAPFEAGRRFYRVWLELCRTGFSVCPMSALTDAPAGAAFLRERCAVPVSERIVNVWRVGEAPRRATASPRIPPHELLV